MNNRDRYPMVYEGQPPPRAQSTRKLSRDLTYAPSSKKTLGFTRDEWLLVGAGALGLVGIGLAVSVAIGSGAQRTPAPAGGGGGDEPGGRWSPDISGPGPLPPGILSDAYLQCNFDAVELPPGTNRTRFKDAQPYLLAASKEFDVPLDFLNSIARAESGFKPTAKSPVGAMGMMQLMPKTAESLFADLKIDGNPYDMRDAARAGALYLRRLLARYRDRFANDPAKNAAYAAAAYNCGPGCVDKYLAGVRDQLPSETKGYIDKVMSYLPYFSQVLQSC